MRLTDYDRRAVASLPDEARALLYRAAKVHGQANRDPTRLLRALGDAFTALDRIAPRPVVGEAQPNAAVSYARDLLRRMEQGT